MNTNLSARSIFFGIVQASLLLSVAACTSSVDDGENDGNQPGASTPTPTAPSSSGPEYRVGCGGDVTPAGLAIGLTPKCVGGEPGTFCGDETPDACAAQDVSFSYVQPGTRCSSTVFSWDGKACVPHETSGIDGALRCKGKGCASLYKDEAACKAAHTGCAAK